MQDRSPEWRTKFQRAATTSDSKKGSKRYHGNSGSENFVHPAFKISGSDPALSVMTIFKFPVLCDYAKWRI